MSQKAIAEMFRVTAFVVHRLVKESVLKPQKLQDLKAIEHHNLQRRLKIRKVATGLLDRNVPILNAVQVVKACDPQSLSGISC